VTPTAPTARQNCWTRGDDIVIGGVGAKLAPCKKPEFPVTYLGLYPYEGTTHEVGELCRVGLRAIPYEIDPCGRISLWL
jgi:hypothetical protein